MIINRIHLTIKDNISKDKVIITFVTPKKFLLIYYYIKAFYIRFEIE